MSGDYPGDGWSRLRDWINQQQADCQSQIMSGACTPEDYRALCAQAQAWTSALNQMKLIASGKDILERRAPSPLRNVE